MAYRYFYVGNYPLGGESGKFFYSDDGESWTERLLPDSDVSSTRALYWDKDDTYYISADAENKSRIYSTTDLSNYTVEFSSDVDDGAYLNIVGDYIFARDYNRDIYQNDGTGWVLSKSLIDTIVQFKIGDEYYIIERTEGFYATTPGDWTEFTISEIEHSLTENQRGVVFKDKGYFYDDFSNVYRIGERGTPEFSVVKVEDTTIPEGEEAQIGLATDGTYLVKTVLIYSSGQQIALYSEDGVNWTDFSSNIPSGYLLGRVDYFKNKFYFSTYDTSVGQLGYMTSEDLVNYSSFQTDDPQMLIWEFDYVEEIEEPILIQKDFSDTISVNYTSSSEVINSTEIEKDFSNTLTVTSNFTSEVILLNLVDKLEINSKIDTDMDFSSKINTNMDLDSNIDKEINI